MSDDKPILCLDFDGVLHRYSRGWRGGHIYDPVTPGFFAWVEEARKKFRLVIYSSRSKHPDGINMMAQWLIIQAENEAPNWQMTDFPEPEHNVLRFLDAKRAELLLFTFAHEKPAAFLTIDDRAIRFDGDWALQGLSPDALLAFKPWNYRS